MTQIDNRIEEVMVIIGLSDKQKRDKKMRRIIERYCQNKYVSVENLEELKHKIKGK